MLTRLEPILARLLSGSESRGQIWPETIRESVFETVLENFASAALSAITRSRVCRTREPTPRGVPRSVSANGTASGTATNIKKVIQ